VVNIICSRTSEEKFLQEHKCVGGNGSLQEDISKGYNKCSIFGPHGAFWSFYRCKSFETVVQKLTSTLHFLIRATVLR